VQFSLSAREPSAENERAQKANDQFVCWVVAECALSGEASGVFQTRPAKHDMPLSTKATHPRPSIAQTAL
jgi:hypothetical protein